MAEVKRNRLVTGALIGGGLAAVAGAFLIREKLAERPDYAVEVADGAYQIRSYPPLLVAETVKRGARYDALNDGFRTLADYIFAKSRSGKKIAMTAPVLSDREGGNDWRVRFVMPAAYTADTLPPPSPGVEIEQLPARRVAAIRFSGLARDTQLEANERKLRTWLEGRGETRTSHAEYAFYDAPFVPGPLRRNEVLIALE